MIAVLFIVMFVLAGLLWREWRTGSLPEAIPPTVEATRSPAVANAASSIGTRSPVTVAAPAVDSVLPPPAPLSGVSVAVATASTAEKPAVNLDPPPAPRNSAQRSTEILKLSQQLSVQLAEMPAARLPASPRRPTVPTSSEVATATNLPVRQVAADETVVIARSLWSEGSRAAALATLREALATAETARSNRAAAPLARELARLEVADNRAQVALDLLRRLEGLFGDDADAWALRGNAEQRLVMHTEAAQSYLAALRLRPTEGKWMLGAAISLAASGKLDEAQNWVERAREREAVTPTIAAYLQQLGIKVIR